jgi:UV excision repair protein RAD23
VCARARARVCAVLQGFGADRNPALAQAIQADLGAFIEMMNATDDPEPAPPAQPAPGVGGAGGMPGMPGLPAGMNPQMMMQMMQMIAQMSPEQLQQLQAQTGLTPEQLQQMGPMIMQQLAQGGAMPGMGGAGGGGGGGGDPPGTMRIQLTPEDAAAIDRLAELGFDKNECLQAYMACDKNEEMAANFLFTNPPE